ncbi:helix-turn-helix domain-containing protein [Leifsonia sp. EB34]|uniref:helix-turn-helix domain-containing protein n=1 Tax=Leifsonia sp. EB34 TaxID=3156303 RepID=UPI003512E76C
MLRSLRDVSGLTWDQIARLFGVSRRAVHHWAAGDTMNAHNHEWLSKVSAVVASMPGISPSERRDALMRPDSDGLSPYDALRRAVSSGSADINRLPVSLAALMGVETA